MTEQPDFEGFLYAASKDALAAKALFDADVQTHCEAIAFHCQQAAEKMLKNVFVENDESPSKIHDLGELLSKAVSAEWLDAAEEELRSAVDLAPFAVAARYETSPDITEAEARKAIQDCNIIANMLERNGYASMYIRA